MEKIKTCVITISDKGYIKEREDTGGPLVCKMVEEFSYEVIYTSIVPDEKDLIEKELIKCSDVLNANFILTTGGTGFSKRDVTPEATINVCEKLVPGIPEFLRYESSKITKRAMLSRAQAGIRKNALIVNLPGSPKAIKENLEALLPNIGHGIEILIGSSRECGSEVK